MTISRTLLISTIAACAGSASAQMTPQEFIAELSELYESSGGALIIGAQTPDGDGLLAEDVLYEIDTDQLSMVVNVGEMNIQPSDEPGFDLEVRFSDEMQMTMAGDADLGMPDMRIDLAYPGNRMLVGGTLEDRLWIYEAESMRVSMLDVDMPDAGNLTVDFVMNTLDGEFRLLGGTDGTMVSDLTAADMSFSYSLGMPDVTISVSGAYEDVTAKTEGDTAMAFDAAAVMEGRGEIVTEMTVGSGSGRMVADHGDQQTLIEGTGGGARVGVALSGAQMGYDYETSGVSISVSGGQVPVPVDLTFAELSGRFAMPMAPSEEAGEMGMVTRMIDVAASEPLWAMIDPQGILPRDPMTLIMDFTSTARATVNFFDPEGMETMVEPPWEFEDVTLSEFRLSAAGAEVTASGAATIDMDAPMPMPVGAVDVSLTGVMGLLDKLAEAGLVPAEQSMPVKMMMGMFAVPGEEPDTFTSRIEMDASGMVTANGVPLQ